MRLIDLIISYNKNKRGNRDWWPFNRCFFFIHYLSSSCRRSHIFHVLSIDLVFCVLFVSNCKNFVKLIEAICHNGNNIYVYCFVFTPYMSDVSAEKKLWNKKPEKSSLYSIACAELFYVHRKRSLNIFFVVLSLAKKTLLEDLRKKIFHSGSKRFTQFCQMA